MIDPSVPNLAPWQSFYVIVGSSSGALIGLQFVVMTLMADDRLQRSPEAISAFATPTVVQFSLSLLISAIMSIGWSSLLPPALLLGATGLWAIVHGLRAARRAHRQSVYAMVWQDRLTYMVIPNCAYLALIAGALLLRMATDVAADLVAVAALVLLFLGIHNAWDTVTYIVLAGPRAAGGSAAPRSGDAE